MVMFTRLFVPHLRSTMPGMQRHDRHRGQAVLEAAHVGRDAETYTLIFSTIAAALRRLTNVGPIAAIKVDRDLAQLQALSQVFNGMPLEGYVRRALAELADFGGKLLRVVAELSTAGKVRAEDWAQLHCRSWSDVGQLLKLYEQHHGGKQAR
jgi:hypothetical protein